MAADQRRKRLNGVSVISYGSPEQHRTKRKNLGLVRSDLTMKSHISIEWDGNHQRVVAKREQIGISWRQMRPFVNFIYNAHSVVADVLAIPQEIFGLDNLSEVLSYEVWNMHLLDNERNHLMQFLPSDGPNQVIQELLSGDNFHFGNPFLKWGASLCAGDLHPDMIINLEQHLRSEKKAYYSQLHNYHKDMVGFLIKLKERWEKCKDPEKETVQKIWRSKNDAEKRTLSQMNGFGIYVGNLRTKSKPYSWAAEEKVHSNYQNSSTGHGNELQRRVLDKGFNEGKPLPRNLMVSSDYLLKVGARPKKRGKLPQPNFHSSNSDKYMPYIKITKKQHKHFKSMKLSCKSSRSSTFNCVLGNLDNTYVQPLEIFVEEEQKMHEHWLQVVNRDIPAAYVKWKERLIHKHAMRNSLAVEMKDKSKPVIADEDIVRSGIQPQYQEEGGGLNDRFSLEDDKDSISRSPENQSLHNSYHCGEDELNPLIKDVLSKSDHASHNKTEYSQIMNPRDVPNNKGASFTSDDHAWQAVEMPHSYCNSVVTHKYRVTGLSMVNLQVNEEQRGQLLERQSDDDPSNSYQSQDQVDLLQSLFNQKGVNIYHHEPKRAGPNFQTSNKGMMGNGQFSSHFNEPLQTSLNLDQEQRKASEVYMPENMSDNISSNGGRYLIPRQDPLAPVNITDRSVNAPFLGAPSGSLVNTRDFVGHNWFSGGQVCSGRNGSDFGSLSSQRLGTRGNSNQSLFSVLSQCSQLRSGSPYESVRHSNQFLALRTYGMVDAGKPRIKAVVPPPSSHPLDYFNGYGTPDDVDG